METANFYYSMDEEIYLILKMLSEHRITSQMAKRLLDALELLKKAEGKGNNTAKSTNISEAHEIEKTETTQEAMVMESVDMEIIEEQEELPKTIIPEIPSFIQPTIADEETIARASVDYFNNESASANEFRRLVRNILHNEIVPDIKSILITSATKNEGKSLITANLAIAIAQKELDKKVLLIDCDLRKPVIHSLFGIDKEPGLVSLILEEAGLDEVVCDTGLGNLKVIPSGRITDSPSVLLPEINNIIDKCKNWFDIILCDSPPVIAVDDAATLGQYTDGVLFVIMAGKTDRMMVKRAMDMLNDAKVTVLGIALNNAHGTLPYYYDHKYYGYKPDKDNN